MSADGIEAVGAATGDERHDMRLMTLLRSIAREKLSKGAAETLREVRRALAWRHLARRVLTLGLWRSRWWRAGA